MNKHRKAKNILKNDLSEKVDHNIAYLFITTIAILPLLLRFKVNDFIAPRIIAAVLDTGTHTDAFSYYKWLFLICVTIIVLFLFLYRIVASNYQIHKSYINIPIFIIALFILLSFLSAEYKSIALVGIYNQLEGAVTYLCFLTLFFVAANTVFRDWFAHYVVFALGFFSVFNMIIILLNFFGYDILQHQMVLSLTIPTDLQNSFVGYIVSTLSNPNYVSGVGAALFSFFLCFVLLETRFKYSIFYIVLSVSAFTLMLASISSSGFVSLLITSPFIIAIAFFLSMNKKHMLINAILTLVICLAAFLVLNNYNPTVTQETINFTENIKSRPANNVIIDKSQNPFSLPQPKMSAGSGRAYIWSETIKLIIEKPLMGHGLDTISYYFPQNDINKISGLGGHTTLISKPHNWYLAIAFGCGIPALIAVLFLFFMHIYHTGLNLLKTERNNKIIFPAALFLFFCSFSAQWLFNDSVIGSSTIFWILFGAAVSYNINWEHLVGPIKNK